MFGVVCPDVLLFAVVEAFEFAFYPFYYWILSSISYCPLLVMIYCLMQVNCLTLQVMVLIKLSLRTICSCWRRWWVESCWSWLLLIRRKLILILI